MHAIGQMYIVEKGEVLLLIYLWRNGFTQNELNLLRRYPEFINEQIMMKNLFADIIMFILSNHCYDNIK